MRSGTGKRALGSLSVIVFVVVVASSLAVSFAVRAVVADQQHRLLQERAGEAADLVSTAFGSLGSTLPTLAATYPPGPGATAQFTSAARSDLGLVSTIGALTQESGSFRVLASVGTGPGVGVTVAADRAELARRALATKSVVDASIQTAKGPRLSFALNAGHGQVLYEDLAFDPTMPLNLGPHGPFNELDGALYASHTPTPSSLVITTTKQLPLAGQVVRTTVSVGSQTWVLVARSRGPLVGSLAANAPWVALAGGLAAALLLSVLVETLGRRRAYALELVEEKTSELRAALEVQAGLEQGQRQAREAAEAANRAKSEFLSRMSHELRTPLNAILGFGQLLELDELGPTQQDSVDQILKGGRHLLDLINEILDISRIETGALALSPEPVSVPEAVADVLTLMQPLAAERRIGLIAAQSQPGGPDADSYVLADRQRLKQVLLNLVANAIKYNRDGGQVRLTWEPDGDGLNIKVTDTGLGIRAEDLGRLFVPFERLDAGASGVEGAGVGLALCRRLAEAMGGRIDVESTRGQGSCFSVRLPQTEGPLERYERLHGDEAAVEASASTSEPAHRVLYIEDNLSNLRLIERVLAQRGDLAVIPAMQGRLGLELAHDLRPDLILLDLHLPDLGGDEVLRALRADPVTAGTPVIMLSADATSGQIERLLAAGADAYLTKPIDVHELIETLTEKLGPSGLSTNPMTSVGSG